MRRKYPITPLGGINKSRPAHEIPLNFTPDCSGVWPHLGRLTRIHGKEKHIAEALAGAGVMKLYTFVDGSQNEYELAITNTKAYRKSGSSYVDIHDSTDFTGTVDNQVAAVNHFDSTGSEICIISNILDAPRKWTGSGTISDLDGSPPKAQILLPYRGYLLAGYVDESGTIDARKVRYSALYNGESWPAANYFRLKTSSDPLVGMNLMRDRVSIYKEDSISLLDYVGGSLTFDLTENFINDVGPASAAAVVPWGKHSEQHYFIGQDAQAYVFDGIDHKHISRRIDPILNNINPSYKNRISGVAIPELGKIIWAVPYAQDTTCLTIFIYDILQRSWWVRYVEPVAITTMGRSSLSTSLTWDTLPYASWDEWEGTWDDRSVEANSPITLIGHTDGYVRKYTDGVDDDGADIASYYVTPFDNLDEKNYTVKEISKIYIEVKTYTADPIKVEIYADHNLDDTVEQNEDGDKFKLVSIVTDDLSDEYFLASMDVAIQARSIAVKISKTSGLWSAKIKGFDYMVLGADFNTALEAESSGSGSEGLDYELDFEL